MNARCSNSSSVRGGPLGQRSSEALEVIVRSVELRGGAHSESCVVRQHAAHSHHNSVFLEQPLAQLPVLFLSYLINYNVISITIT